MRACSACASVPSNRDGRLTPLSEFLHCKPNSRAVSCMSAVEPIAIVGIGCRFPGGVRSTEDLELVVGGRRRRRRYPRSALASALALSSGSRQTGPDDYAPGSSWITSTASTRNSSGSARARPRVRIRSNCCCWKSPMMPSRMPALPWICWRAGGGVYVGIATWDYSFLQIKSEAQLRRCIHQHRYRSVHSGQPDLLLLQPRRPESRRRHRMLVLARRYPSCLSKHLERRERNGVRGRGERAGAA